jgi:prevent-host-death family protein
MKIVNVHEAKTHLSKILERVARGEQIVIARSGRPVAKLIPIARSVRKPGRLKGRITVSDDFDAPLPDRIALAFRGKTP